jgi:hypothetical protein
MQRLDPGERCRPPPLTPGQEINDGPGIGAPGVGVADGGGEKFQEADLRPFAGRRDEGRQSLRSGDLDKGPAAVNLYVIMSFSDCGFAVKHPPT